MTNYRPIFVLSPFAQVFEKIFYQQLYNFLTKQKFCAIINLVLEKDIQSTLPLQMFIILFYKTVINKNLHVQYCYA